MRVIILGAGASKAYSDSPTGFRMPVANDFFETFSSLEVFNNPLVLYGGVQNYVRDKLGVQPTDFPHFRIDIEELHSMIEADLHELQVENMERELSLEKSVELNMLFRTYHELVFLFACVVSEIQNGPISEPHRKLAKCLSASDSIVTFNWDTLCDRALAEETDWSVDDGYALQPHMIFRDGWAKPVTVRQHNPCIIKLHGSCNWLSSAPIQRPGGDVRLIQKATRDTLYVYEYATKPYSTYAGRYMGGYEPFSCGYYPPNILDDEGLSPRAGHVFCRARFKFPWTPKPTADDKGLPTIPLIIPPVRNKRYDFHGSLFRDLWAAAESSLTAANSILVIGYSFPLTDTRSREMFTSSFLKRESVPRVTIVDPAPDRAAEFFRIDLGIPDDKLIVCKEPWTDSMDMARLLGKP